MCTAALPWHKLTNLTVLQLPTVLLPAAVFAELLDHLRSLQVLSVSASVLLLRFAQKEEPAIECYDDEGAFPPKLTSLSFHNFNPPPQTLNKKLPSVPDPAAEFITDSMTAETLQRLAEILSNSSPHLEVLKFKLAPGIAAISCLRVFHSLMLPHSSVLEPIFRHSALMNLRTLHTLQFNHMDILA